MNPSIGSLGGDESKIFLGGIFLAKKSSPPDEIEKRLMNREIHEPSTSFFARIDFLARESF